MANPLLAPPKSYEDTAFVVGDSGVVLDFFTDLGNRADGYFKNDGPGNIGLELQHIPTAAYGDIQTLTAREIIHFEGVATIRLTHIVDAAYRANVQLSRGTA